jgi:peptide/nickel transport system substrate-binding protein
VDNNKTELHQLDRRSVLKLTGSSVAAASLAGCTGGDGQNVSSDGDGQNENNGELVVGFEAELPTLDPHFSSSAAVWTVNYNILETLITFEDGKLAGRLAEDWSVSDDGQQYTFKLKEGVMFHPPVNREMVAEDVVYSFDRMNQEGAFVSSLSVVEDVEATDKYEVTFTLSEAFAPLLNFFARVRWVIVPEEAVQDQDAESGDFQEPVGTGPFVFDEYEPGNYLRLQGSDDYHVDDTPKVDTVQIQIIPDQDSRVAALQSGDVDMARSIAGKDAAQIESNPDATLEQQPGTTWAQIHINCSSEPWSNPAVRRAVAHVVNRNSIVEGGANGYGRAAWQPYPEDSRWHYDLGNSRRQRNIEKAKQILEDAGNPLDGETLTIQSNTSFSIMETTADLCVANLNEAGIDASVETVEWGTQLDNFLNDNYGAMAFSVPFKIDPDRHYFDFIHPDGSQFNSYGSEQPDAQRMYELVAQGRRESDIDKRVEIYTEFQQLINKNVPWISIALTDDLLGVQSNADGYSPWLLPYSRWWTISV